MVAAGAIEGPWVFKVVNYSAVVGMIAISLLVLVLFVGILCGKCFSSSQILSCQLMAGTCPLQFLLQLDFTYACVCDCAPYDNLLQC